MAVTQVSEQCLICESIIEPETKSIFVGLVQATKMGRSGTGDGGMSFGGTFKQVKEGKLRIRHLPGGKPRGLICLNCVEKVFGKKRK